MNFKICLLNMTSLTNKMDELEIFLNTIGYPLFIGNVVYNRICLQTYTLVDYYCRSFYNCGDMTIFVRKDVQYSKIECSCDGIDNILNTQYFEYGIPFNNLSIIVTCFYRYPSGALFIFLDYMNFLCCKNLRNDFSSVFVGDFNFSFNDTHRL